MAFKCIVMTPEQQVVDQQIQQAIIPAHDGLMGILDDRAPIIARLGTGPLRIDLPDGRTRHFFVDGGLAQMKQDTLTILTSVAIPAAELDSKATQDELALALEHPTTTPEQIEQREQALARARTKHALLGKA